MSIRITKIKFKYFENLMTISLKIIMIWWKVNKTIWVKEEKIWNRIFDMDYSV